MTKLLSLSLLTLIVLLAAACRQDPQSPTGPQTVLPLSTGGSTAHPALTYQGRDASNHSQVCVMDTDAKHQTAILTASSTVFGYGLEHWSGTGGSIAFVRRQMGYNDIIQAIDVSVNSKGVPVGSNLRSVCSLPNSDQVGTIAWSSTSGTNEIAYVTRNPNGQSADLWVVSANGGTATLLYHYDSSWFHRGAALMSPTWNPDDTRMAFIRPDSGLCSNPMNTILIFNTSTWQIIDSVKVSGTGANGMEWSRSGLNKLAFVMQPASAAYYRIYYVSPTFGSTQQTDSVKVLSGQHPVTWSPNNSALMWSNMTYTPYAGLNKIGAFRSSITSVSSSFTPDVNWKR